MFRAMTTRYRTFSVEYEHTIEGSDQRVVNRAVLTVYGDSELAIAAELARQHTTFRNIVVLSADRR
jgi:RNase P/RNase MRP subunit POP5